MVLDQNLCKMINIFNRKDTSLHVFNGSVQTPLDSISSILELFDLLIY